MLDLIKALDWKAVTSALKERPELLECRSRKGENLLHLCCGIDVAKRGLRSADSIKTAGALLAAGLDLDAPAFQEDSWKATPLWYAVAHGKNLKLAAYLLERGADPEYCMYAAAYNDDEPMVRLLFGAGAAVDPDGDGTPLLFAVQWSRFAGAKALLECGADPNFKDSKGRTALHYMLKKRSDPAYVRTFLKHGARLDVADRDGNTAFQILSRMRDPSYRALAKGGS